MSDSEEYKAAVRERVGDSQLGKELFTVEPRLDLLHELLGFGRFSDFYFDGTNYLAQAKGDIGYNHFMGSPSAIAISRLRKEVDGLTPACKAEALRNPHVFRLYSGRILP